MLQGGYTCGPCKKGYMGDAFYGCYPDDFCAENKHNCAATATCVYVGPGLFRCEVSVLSLNYGKLWYAFKLKFTKTKS